MTDVSYARSGGLTGIAVWRVISFCSASQLDTFPLIVCMLRRRGQVTCCGPG